MKKQREEYAQRQKEAALQRAAELVQSNRVPVELTGAAVAAANPAETTAAFPAVVAVAEQCTMTALEPPPKKIRSSIVISTASDLHQIVTHSNNLWAKYNAIAKANNQRVNWVVVSKELGIHVKVREKYARMHSRALARGFDFDNWGHYRIKDYPQYFTDPLGPGIEATLQANAMAAPGATEMPMNAPLGPGIEASLHTNIMAAQGATQVSTLGNVLNQMLYHPVMNASVNRRMYHDAIMLAAEVAAGEPGSDSFSDDSGEAGSVPPTTPGPISAAKYPENSNAYYSV
jgi:hypothetical protein